MKPIVATLAVLLLLLQYTLWAGQGGLRDVWHYKQQIAEQQEENRVLSERNRALEAEVLDLKQGLEALEERARSELGMVKEGETFFQVIGE
ncbi:cell division protein FtsB [Ectothiorhodospiraceae bacterium 2226]|nr:cell division protein FtsB [Ectothiorhodospiraceae bacterium 2226]